MKEPDSLFVFILDGQRYALPLPVVDRVVRMVAITRLPRAQGIVLGVVNIQGRVTPVINLRRRFGLPEREAILTDQLVIAHTAQRHFALVVDSVLGGVACPAQHLIEIDHDDASAEYRVAKLEDGLVLIHDLDRFLSLEEEHFLDSALETA